MRSDSADGVLRSLQRLSNAVGARETHAACGLWAAGEDDHRPGVESASGHDRGYDVANRMAGSERHLLVETNRLVLAARVHSTDLPDRAAGGGC